MSTTFSHTPLQPLYCQNISYENGITYKFTDEADLPGTSVKREGATDIVIGVYVGDTCCSECYYDEDTCIDPSIILRNALIDIESYLLVEHEIHTAFRIIMEDILNRRAAMYIMRAKDSSGDIWVKITHNHLQVTIPIPEEEARKYFDWTS